MIQTYSPQALLKSELKDHYSSSTLALAQKRKLKSGKESYAKRTSGL